MAAIGSMGAFNVKDPASWELYVEQLECYCEANDITEESRKRVTLLTVIGTDALGVLRTLISPESPRSRTYEELVATMRNHFMPQTSLIYKRFLFHKRIQKADETISAYIRELRQLAEDCDFGVTLNERLRDQLVCGLRNGAIQQRLLAETSLTLEEATKTALAGEAAANEAKEFQVQNSTVDVTSSSHYTRLGKCKHPSLKRQEQNSGQKRACAGCGGQHKRTDCKFKDSECYFCHKKGHIAKVCRSQGSKQQKSQQRPAKKNGAAHRIEEPEEVYAESHIHCTFPFREPMKKIRITVSIEGQPLSMEVDSGSNFSVISLGTYRKLWPVKGPAIKKSELRLHDYQKNLIKLLGYCNVNVVFKQINAKLRLLVAKGNRESLLGLEWFAALGLYISGVNQVKEDDTIDNVLTEFRDVFSETLGAYTGPEISLPLNPKVPPKRFKARNVPLAIRARIEDELDRLLKQGVIEPINSPKWSTPVVPVIKPSGAIRLCGDYKVTINTALQDHPYPIPTVTQLLSNLSGGGLYAKIDMAQAYLQLPVDNESAEAQTIITHRGAFKVKRLQFGVSVAPGIFQQVMDEALRDVPGVTPYFDDILIRASTTLELAHRLRQVLQIFRKLGLRAKKEKCLFGVRSIDFLGYRIDARGIHPSPKKVEAIHNATAPGSRQELQAFLGLLNFYNSFLKDKATLAEPLHRLLDKNAEWKWTKEHEKSFNAVKKLLTSDSVLAPFDSSLPTTLTCDASPYGVGAVLSQRNSNGQDVPVAFSSCTLTKAERNYAQIDKEALAIVSGIKKFHHFLYGRKFTLVTDHKPLLGLFTNAKPTPDILSPRMLRWSILLQAYEFDLVHKPASKISHADALSRLSFKAPNAEVPSLPEVFFLEELPAPPLTATEIAKMTALDPQLSRVLNWAWKGWPANVDKEFQSFARKKNELSVHKNCLLWGNRVIIPRQGQARVLEELHLNHPGIVRMKALARSYVWWPSMDADIEKFVSKCLICQQSHHSPPKAPVHHWEVPRNPWSRLHVDFAGPFQGENFLIIVDAYSKWLEVKRMRSVTTQSTVEQLRELFSTHGIPDSIVSDNGPQFTSDEFQQFCKKNLIRSILISPYHASSNGQAERMVQYTKDSLKKIITGSWHKRLSRFLLSNHVTPSTATGVSPAELLMGRKLKTCLDRLHPDYWREKQLKLDITSAKTDKAPTIFQPKDPVFVRSSDSASAWIPATVTEQTGPVSYEAVKSEGKTVRRHLDLMQKRTAETHDGIPTELDAPEETEPSREPSATPPASRPLRKRAPPKYLDDYVL